MVNVHCHRSTNRSRSHPTSIGKAANAPTDDSGAYKRLYVAIIANALDSLLAPIDVRVFRPRVPVLGMVEKKIWEMAEVTVPAREWKKPKWVLGPDGKTKVLQTHKPAYTKMKRIHVMREAEVRVGWTAGDIQIEVTTGKEFADALRWCCKEHVVDCPEIIIENRKVKKKGKVTVKKAKMSYNKALMAETACEETGHKYTHLMRIGRFMEERRKTLLRLAKAFVKSRAAQIIEHGYKKREDNPKGKLNRQSPINVSFPLILSKSEQDACKAAWAENMNTEPPNRNVFMPIPKSIIGEKES